MKANNRAAIEKLEEAHQVLVDCEPEERRSLGIAWASELIVGAIHSLQVSEQLEKVLDQMNVIGPETTATTDELRRVRDLVQKTIYLIQEEPSSHLLTQSMRQDWRDPRHP